MRDKASITGNVRSFPQSVTEVIFEETFIITNLRSFKLHMKVYYTVTTVIKTFYMKLYSRFLASEKYTFLYVGMSLLNTILVQGQENLDNMSNCIEILNKCSGMDFPKNDSGYMVLTQCDFAQLPISEEKKLFLAISPFSYQLSQWATAGKEFVFSRNIMPC